MYGGQPLPPSHHGQQPFSVPDDMPVHLHGQPIMDAPDFGGFGYSFDAPIHHDPGPPMMPLPSQQAALHHHHQPHPAHQQHHQHSSFVAPDAHSIHTPPVAHHEPRPDTSSVPRPSFDAGIQPDRRPSATPSIAAQPERKSSLIPDALDDSAADGTDLGAKTKDANKSDAPPPWSELKTKAGKDRKRLPLACIACRRKKIRCSGEKPACKHCLRSRTPCVYKVTTRKAAPRTDYMAMLDKRLKRMEDRIIKIIPKSDQGSTANVTRAVVKPAIPGTLGSNKPLSRKRGADDAFGPDFEAWAQQSPEPGPETDDSLEAHEDDENKLFHEGRDALPPKETQEHLAEVYFDHIYGQAYPLLHKPSYMRKLKNNSLPPVLILSVCAVAARFSASPKINESARQCLRGEQWAAPARDICTRRYGSPNITILTCLLILGLHEFGTCQGSRSWALGGQATRMAFALQLHKDLDYDPLRKKGQAKLSFVDREIRRRVMWSCFLMDRFNSSGTDRPMFITPDVIETPLPVKERHFLLDMPAVTEKLDGSLPSDSLGGVNAAGDAAENLGVSAFIIRTVALWGRITTYVNQGGITSDLKPMSDETSGFTKLVREAEALLHGLPEALHYSSDNISLHQIHHTANQFLLLHLILQQNMLFLFRTAISVTSGGGRPDDGFMANARSRALEAAARISDILRDAEESRVVISAPVAGYCAFSSTSMHIRVILSGHPANKATAETNAATNIRFLRKIMKFWGMFHWMEEDVRTQYRRALDRSRSGLPPDDSEAAAPILQYGDWFSRYPHGVSDSDFNDPASQQKKREKGADGVLEQKPELHSVEEFFTMLASPKGSDKQQQQQQQQSAAKRKATGKKVVGPSADKVPAPKATTLAQKKNRPPALETVGVQSMTPGPESTHLHQQAQLQQPQARRPSVPLGSQTAGTPSPFHNPFTSSHPQAPTTYTMSPISPVNQFTPGNVAATSAAGPHPPPPPPQQQQPQPQPQQQFFPANMMHQHMGMAPQPQPQQMGPLDQTLSFGGYPMDPHAHHQGQQHIMGPTWHDAAPPGSNGGQQTAHQPQQNGLGDMDHHHAHAHAQAHVPGGNGLGPDGWFVTPDMQSADAFAGMFGGGMHQNPLGGLRHAQ